MKSYCSSSECKNFNEEFIVDDNTLICTCERVYCTNCWVDANDEFFQWHKCEDTIFGPSGEMFIDGCDNCNYDFDIKTIDRKCITDEMYKNWEEEDKKQLEYLKRNKNNYENLKNNLEKSKKNI